MAIDATTYSAAVGAAVSEAKRYHDEHSGGNAIMVGTVTNGGSFPTARPNGGALVIGDFVKPAASSTFPFTIGSITFMNASDQAVFDGNGNWMHNANPFQSTADTPVKVKAEESVTGTASTQSDVNKELVQKRGYVHTQTAASASWSIAHNMGKRPVVLVIDSAGSVCEGDVSYTDENNMVLTFSAAFSGSAYLS